MIIFHSGFEKASLLERLLKLVSNGLKVSGILVSFLNLKNDRKSLELLRKLKEKNVKIMLDSGAHSFLLAKGLHSRSYGHEASKKALRILEEDRLDYYVRELINFVKMTNLFDIYVELDIKSIVGKERIEEWRKWWKEEKLQPMYVWHGESVEEVENWINDTRFIGLGGTGKEQDLEKRYVVARRIKERYKDIFVHSFAETSWDNLKKIRSFVDSVDSTSWISGKRFGVFYIFENNLILLDKYEIQRLKNSVRKNRKELEEMGFDIEKIESVDLEEIDFFNLWSFSKAEEFLNTVAKENETVKVERIDRDPKTGRFVEGNLVALKHGLYARKFKIIDCDSCYIRDRCSFYQAGAICAFKKIIIKKYKTRDLNKLVNLMWDALEDIDRRLEVAEWYEVKDGGRLDKSIDRLLQNKIFLMRVLSELYQSPTVIQNIQVAPQTIILQKFDAIYEAYMKKMMEEKEKERMKKLSG